MDRHLVGVDHYSLMRQGQGKRLITPMPKPKLELITSHLLMTHSPLNQQILATKT